MNSENIANIEASTVLRANIKKHNIKVDELGALVISLNYKLDLYAEIVESSVTQAFALVYSVMMKLM